MILAWKLRIPKIQFAKHMKLKKKDNQNVDTSILLRIGKKIPMKGVTETKCGAETAPPGNPSYIQSPNPDTILDAKKCLLKGAYYR